MALPAEPRQKMINLMYLVLTAMLALNVSAEILNAFKIVDNSLARTNGTINNSTETILASLQEKTTDPATAEKAKIWYPKAQQAQALSKEMFQYIQGVRERVMKEAGFDPVKKHDSTFNMEDRDMITRVMINDGEGKRLYDKLADYKAKLLAIDPAIGQEFKNALQIDLSMPPVLDKSNNTWEEAYFHMVPTVAAMT